MILLYLLGVGGESGIVLTFSMKIGIQFDLII